jgi:hypothetical protein
MSNPEQGSAAVPTQQCSCTTSQYIYSASAYGFAGELERPSRHSIPSQAASVLGADGGRGSNRVQNFKFDGFLSVADAHTEVGGSYDDCHNRFTTYAFSSLEGVNVADMLTADRVVSRLYIYAPANPADKSEPSFTITGSHFDNLRIAGYKVDVQLATSEFHTSHDTLTGAGTGDKWLLASQLAESKKDLQALEKEYHALKGIKALVDRWKEKGQTKGNDKEGGEKHGHCRTYLLSPIKQLKLEGYTGSDIQILGNIICIPKFGVIRLADLLVHGHCRSLTMFRVQMCSATGGSTDGGGTVGSGGRP